MRARDRLSPQQVQYLATGLTAVTVPLAAAAGLMGLDWVMYALVALFALGAFILATNKCPRCGFPVRKKSGHWPFAMPKALGEKHCANCGLDLSKPFAELSAMGPGPAPKVDGPER